MHEQERRARVVDERTVVEPELADRDVQEQGERRRNCRRERRQLGTLRTSRTRHKPDRAGNADEREDRPGIEDLGGILASVMMAQRTIERVEQRPIHDPQGNDPVTARPGLSTGQRTR